MSAPFDAGTPSRMRSATWCLSSALCALACSTAEPQTLASGQAEPWGIALHAGNVYFSEHDHARGAIQRVSTNGVSVTTLAASQSSPGAIATDGVNLYWVNGDVGSVMMMPIAGGTPTALASAQNNPDGLVTDGVNVYFTDQGSQPFGTPSSDGALMQVSIADGTPLTLVPNLTLPGPLAVDETSVYFTSLNASTMQWSVSEVPIGGGSITTLAGDQFAPAGIAVDDTNVYWQAGQVPPSGGSLDAVVMKVKKTGGALTRLASATHAALDSMPKGFAIDATHVYFVDGADFLKVPKDGGAAVPFALGVGPDATTFALDATFVYWTSTSAGNVLKTPKAP